MLDIRWIAVRRIRLFALGLLLALAACSAPDQAGTPTPAAAPVPAGVTLAKEEITGIQVELMVFSGRANPRWPLTTDEQERVHGLLAQAAPAATQPIEGQLGYSGFSLTLHTATERRMLRIYNGVIMYSGPAGAAFYQDERRGLERLLLETARPHIDPALHQTIRASLPAQ